MSLVGGDPWWSARRLCLSRQGLDTFSSWEWPWRKRKTGAGPGWGDLKRDQDGKGKARIWGKYLPGLPLPLSGHVIFGLPHLLLSWSFCLICKSRDSNNPHLTGSPQRSKRKKGMWKNYVNRKALHKEGSYDLLIPSQSAFQRKLNKLPQTFHSQGYFYFVIFQASKWNWKEKKKSLQRLLFIW